MTDAAHPDSDDGRFDKGGEADDPPPRPLALAHLQLSPIENKPARRFQLRLTLACNIDTIDGADASYELRLRQCHVHLVMQNCTLDYRSAYSWTLPGEVFSGTSTETSRKAASRRGEAAAEAGLAGKFFGHLGVKGSGKISAQRSSGQTAEESFTSQHSLQIIGFIGESWFVGDQFRGDPRHGGYLRERYFHERGNDPLCAVDVKPGAALATVTAEVRVRMGQLDGYLLDPLGRPKREIGAGEAEDIARSLKDRLSGMVVGKTLRAQQADRYPDLPPSVFVLATDVVRAHMPRERTTALSAPVLPAIPAGLPTRTTRRQSKSKP
ncbi:hypothetical protein [Methylobacterium oryzihabitans]|uniref:Uncharacterized protein n=1 Tax=Methylobacterium oryzihabitans TaxID=2499852 RepID=A0A3S2YXE0_9HYPH|nr:hypothetical protein [Methylobacterium oryzihabitans]RVU21612.1 hypothetical protein EOE48_00710 [Methylobacterium oryzihabitans]